MGWTGVRCWTSSRCWSTKSLVAAEESDGATRYRLLETIRQYALEKLADSGEADEVRTIECRR
jgi:predicted ATPase